MRSDPISKSPFHLTSHCIALAIVLLIANISSLAAEEAWEFSPYKVCMWFAFDPSIDQPDAARQIMIDRTVERLDATFGAGWRLSANIAPPNMSALIERGPEYVLVNDFSSHDMVLMLGKDDESTKTIRVVESAVEQLPAIGITKQDLAQLTADADSTSDVDATSKQLVEKATEHFESFSDLLKGLREKQVKGILVPKGMIERAAEVARPLATVLPWHTERVLRDYDKLILVSGSRFSDQYTFAVRELDCGMRLFGPTLKSTTVAWKNVANVVADLTVDAFAPVARIEEALAKSVKLRTRAGGLMDSSNPAQFSPGDVLQPVIRREERRGMAGTPEPIPWTFIALTSVDGILLEGTVHSALGPVLQGKQTRRAQRIAMRVRPTGLSSDVKVVVRGKIEDTQPGCQIYERDLQTEQMKFIGHTDWRGIIPIARGEQLGSILPEAERLKRAEEKRLAAEAAAKAAAEAEAKAAAERAAAEKARAEGVDVGDPSDTRGPVAQANTTPDIPSGSPAPATVAGAAKTGDELSAEELEELNKLSVPLRQPLKLLYVKSGDTVLARLPIVPGLNELDVADLPSDTRRLEAEAIIKGFQGEVLDLIGKRALMSSRVNSYFKDRKFAEAEAVIREVRLLPDYKKMADALDTIQRKVMDETKEPVSMAAKSRIDRMTQSTRDMLQKYLENDLAQKLEKDLVNAKKAAELADKEAARLAAEKAAADAAAEAAKKEAPKQ